MSLVQIAAFQLLKMAEEQQLKGSEVHKLPPNLKDVLRKLQRIKDERSLYLMPFLLHEKIASLDLSELKNHLPDLRCLNQCPRLKRLNLKRSLLHSPMKEDQICQVFSGLVHLEALYLHYNGAKVTDQILRTIATRCKRLTELDLGQCTQITDFSTLNGLTNLKSLNLSHTKVTDDGLERIFPRKNTTLTELRLDNCKNITDYGIEVVFESCEKLSIFIFHNCPGTTERSLDYLKVGKQTTWTIY